MDFETALMVALESERMTLDRWPVRPPFGGGVPWLEMPASGERYTEMNTANVAVPAVAAEATVVDFTVPVGMNGVVTRVSNQVVAGGALDGSGDFTWRIEINGVTVQGFSSILGSLGSLSNPADFREGPIRLRERQRVKLIFRNVAIAPPAGSLLGLLGGYYYPQVLEVEGTWI